MFGLCTGQQGLSTPFGDLAADEFDIAKALRAQFIDMVRDSKEGTPMEEGDYENARHLFAHPYRYWKENLDKKTKKL